MWGDELIRFVLVEGVSRLTAMKSSIAAVIGGVIGSIIWGSIAYLTGYEAEIVAVGVGALVGYFSIRFGEEGSDNGVICVIVVCLALIGGKFLVVGLTLTEELRPVLEPLYEEQRLEAVEFEPLNSEIEWKKFMVKHEYTKARGSRGVTSIDFKRFEENTAPLLHRLNEGMTYEEYQDVKVAEMGGLTELVKYSFDKADFFFFMSGIIAAYFIGSRHEEKSTSPQGLE